MQSLPSMLPDDGDCGLDNEFEANCLEACGVTHKIFCGTRRCSVIWECHHLVEPTEAIRMIPSNENTCICNNFHKGSGDKHNGRDAALAIITTFATPGQASGVGSLSGAVVVVVVVVVVLVVVVVVVVAYWCSGAVVQWCSSVVV